MPSVVASVRRRGAWCAALLFVALFGACGQFSDADADADADIPRDDAGFDERTPEAAIGEDGNSQDGAVDSGPGDAARLCPCAVVVGGFHREAGAPVFDDETFVAPITPTGALAPWRNLGRLPSATHGLVAAADDTGRIHALGGVSNGGSLSRVAWTALPSDGGTFDAWATTPAPLARATYLGAVATSAGWSFVSGGFDNDPGGGAPIPHELVQSAFLSGPSTMFATTTPLPQPRTRHGSAIANGVLYTVAGTFTGETIVGNITYARVDGGAVAAWTDAGDLPSSVYGQGVYGACLVHARGSLYLIGGSLSGDFPLTTVSRSALDPISGAPGPWTTAISLPKARVYTACAVHDDRIYVFGGADSTSTATPDVHFATVNANGTLTGWTAAIPLPEARSHHAAVIVP